MASTKARLNEYCQKNNYTLCYHDKGVEGPSHDPVFTAAVSINDRMYDSATGKSKKEARGHAAEQAWKTIEQELHADSAAREPQRPQQPSTPPQASQVPPLPEKIPKASPVVNYITWLNEYKQKSKLPIEYIWGDRSGRAHVPIFTVACKIGNKVLQESTGSTKQIAKLNAAKLAYEELNSQPTSRAEQSASSSNNSVCVSLSNSQEVLEMSEEFDEKVTSFTSNTSDSVIFKHSGATSNATDSGLEYRTVDKLNDALVGVKLDETSSLASPKGPGIKPKRKETPLAPKFSNLCKRESRYTNNERFLEDYIDIKRIGIGGFGNVFKAKHAITGSVRAIKRVALSCVMEENENETEGEKAKREVQVLEKLEHENIVRYYTCWIGKDCLSDDSLRRICKCLFIEMEFCENGTLAAWISKNRNTQSHEDSLKKFQQIVEGVHYIHSWKIIHRDLKPDNILISKDNKIKIGDFGLATSGIDDLLIPRTANKGTKRYMAPEQCGSKYGKEVDLYPLGLIFFELVYVFSTDNEKSREWDNIRDCKFPEAFIKKFPTEKSIISKLLSKNPGERPSADKLLNILGNNVESVHTC